MKKIILTLLICLTLSPIGMAKTPKLPQTSIALPELSVSNETKTFAQQYPNMGQATQIELYTNNLSYQVINDSYFSPNDTAKLTDKQVQDIKACSKDFYTADNLNRIYEKQKKLPLDELNQLEKFYASPTGIRYETNKLHLAQSLKQKGLESYLTLPDTQAIITETKADMPILEPFITSKAYNDYFETLNFKEFNTAQEQTKACIENIL